MVAAGWAVYAQPSFHSRRLAVLQAGDGVVSLHLKQSPLFIDEFIPGSYNATPSFMVQIPTNGANSIFINGHVDSNCVVQIVDINVMAMVTTLAQASGAKIAYRGIDFTPEATAH